MAGSQKHTVNLSAGIECRVPSLRHVWRSFVWKLPSLIQFLLKRFSRPVKLLLNGSFRQLETKGNLAVRFFIPFPFHYFPVRRIQLSNTFAIRKGNEPRPEKIKNFNVGGPHQWQDFAQLLCVLRGYIDTDC